MLSAVAAQAQTVRWQQPAPLMNRYFLIGFGLFACAPHSPGEVSTRPSLAASCLRFEHRTATDTIFLDTLPSSLPAWRMEGFGRVIVFPFSTDTLPPQDRFYERRILWRALGDSLQLQWGHLEIVAQVKDSRFEGQRVRYTGVIYKEDGRWIEQGQAGPFYFARIACPVGWNAAT